MKRFLTISASAALAGGVILTALSGVTAVSADASQKAPIQTVIEHMRVSINGVGAGHSWHSRFYEKARVVLSPQLAVMVITSSATGATDKPKVAVTHLVIVNGTSYTKSGDATQYTAKALTAAALAAAANQFNPYFIGATFDAISGVKLVGTRHYQVVANDAKVRAFLDVTFGITGETLTRSAIDAVTIDLWVNTSGQPVKITVAGQSPTDPLTAWASFTSYDQPLTIHQPSTPNN